MADITGTSANDALNGTLDNDNIQGLEGDDLITTNLGFDIVDGGDGTDTLKLDYSSLDGGIQSYIYDSGSNGYYSGYSSTNGYSSSVSFSNVEQLDVNGGAGNDFLNGSTGNDTLRGGTGNDIIYSGGGADVIDGGAGDDGLFGVDYSSSTTNLTFSDATPVSDSISFANGTMATNIEFFDGLTTGSGDDTINYSRYRDNNISTGAGNDIINPGLGASDIVDGGDGTDTLKLDYSSLDGGIQSYIYGSGSSGYYSGYSSTNGYSSVSFSNVEQLDVNGGAGNDFLNGSTGNDTLRGGTGNDIIYSGGGADVIDGGAGDDGLFGVDYSSSATNLTFSDATPISSSISFANGTMATNIEFFDGLTTGSGDDTINYSRYRNSNIISTGAGNDVINPGLGASDIVDGGDATDTLKLDYSSVNGGIQSSVYGFNGSYFGYSSTDGHSSVSFSNVEQLDVNGGAGNDFLNGSTGNDTLRGGTGNDIIYSGGGADVINGGAGDDGLFGVDYSSSTKNLKFSDATPVSDSISFANGTVATNVEFLDGLTTGRGKDTINYSRYRDNNISTGAGNDVINPGLGASDIVDGGDGTDTLKLDYSSLDGGISSSIFYGGFNYGIYFGYSTDGYSSVSFSNVEKFNVTVGAGNDILNGGADSDTLNGGAGIDTLTGSDGKDILIGGADNDILVGGFGNDKFLYSTKAAFVASEVGIDTIDDFTASIDKIVLDKTTFSVLASKPGIGFRVGKDFAIVSSDADGEISTAKIVYNSVNGNLFYNQNGISAGFGTGAQFATLVGEDADSLTSLISTTDFIIQA